MGKRKVTLSIDGDVLRKVRRTMSIGEGRSLSSLVEEAPRGLVGEAWLTGLCDELAIKPAYISPESVVSARPKGSRAEEAVREMGRGREEVLSRRQRPR
ncbi:TPA: hypothetical protein EYP44_03795 [Candidatus Bathyarchaeota archaeon]|nr:hypothetical protein [Candidatus Bathyarchaeota archaeon]